MGQDCMFKICIFLASIICRGHQSSAPPQKWRCRFGDDRVVTEISKHETLRHQLLAATAHYSIHEFRISTNFILNFDNRILSFYHASFVSIGSVKSR